LGQGGLGHSDAGLAAVGGHDQLGAAVGRVRDQPDQAEPLELLDRLMHGLAGDAGPAGELGGPGAGGVQLGEDQGVGTGELGPAGGVQGGDEALVDPAEGPQQQLTKVGLLGHPTSSVKHLDASVMDGDPRCKRQET
jgi:hypothetical protein